MKEWGPEWQVLLQVFIVLIFYVPGSSCIRHTPLWLNFVCRRFVLLGGLDAEQCRRTPVWIITMWSSAFPSPSARASPGQRWGIWSLASLPFLPANFWEREKQVSPFSLGSRQFRLLRRETFAYFMGNDNVYKKLDVSEQKPKNVVSFHLQGVKSVVLV